MQEIHKNMLHSLSNDSFFFWSGKKEFLRNTVPFSNKCWTIVVEGNLRVDDTQYENLEIFLLAKFFIKPNLENMDLAPM